MLVSVPLQELLFRGFCLWRCRLSFHSHWFVALYNSALFAGYHIILQNWYLVGGVFVLNLYWSYAFLRYPNLYAFMLAHALLGTLYFS